MTQLAPPSAPITDERAATAATAGDERIPRRQGERFNQRRAQLAQAAMQTLSEAGYTRASLRDIAQNAAFSHGVLHYYFRDKIDLIAEGIRQYKAICVRRYDVVIATAVTAEEFIGGIGDEMARTVTDEGPMHRLWYDLRTQSFYEPGLRDVVLSIDANLEDMVWRIVTRYAEIEQRPLAIDSSLAYALMDGVVQQSLIKDFFELGSAEDDLRARVRALLTGVALQP